MPRAFGDSVCSIDSRRMAKTPLRELVLLQATSILPGVSVLSHVHMERIGVMVCKKSAYPNCSGALTNCSVRLITVPEDL